MDFSDILGAIPTVGPYGILILIIVYLMKLLLGSDARHSAELERVNKAHDDELAELRADIKELRERLDQHDSRVEDERRRRYRAEEELHELKLNRGAK